MKSDRIVFVILHYLTVKDTRKCIDSILKLHETEKVKIIVVDNCSPNNSGETLKNLYSKNKQVIVLLSSKNLGFAQGNNLGFKYAKYKLNANFIVMINNDTYIKQTDFLKRIYREYEYSKFAVLGPKIILKNNQTNNIYKHLQTLEHYKKDLAIMKRELFLNQIHIYPFYKFARSRLSSTLQKLKLKKRKTSFNPCQRYNNIVLHGCALIFSKEYIKKFDGLDNRTFLYREEELLFLRLRQHGLTNIYNPEIEIYHNEDGATNALTGGSKRKRTFVIKNLIESTKLLISELEKNDN